MTFRKLNGAAMNTGDPNSDRKTHSLILIAGVPRKDA